VGARNVNRVVLGGWLVVVWTALWGRLSIANVTSGIIVSVVLLTIFPVGKHLLPGYIVRPVAVARLAGYFLRKLVESNIALTRAILSRNDQISTGIVAVPMTCESDGMLTVVANLTALTPGTMAIEVERQPPRIYIHVLRLRDIESTRDEVHKLERLVVEAFGPSVARRAIRADADRTGSTEDRA
jgi:multicomponent Na+:H+ antiporter subunit E